MKKILIWILHTLINLAAGIGMGFCVMSAAMEHEAVYLLGVVVFLGISTTSGYVVGAAFGRNNE